MRVVQINTTCGVGSTGKICLGISQLATADNIENYILYSTGTNGYRLGISCSNDRYRKIQALKSRLFGNYGFNSKKATRKMIPARERIRPDLVHLHNIHGHDCDLELLFGYFRQKKTKLVWTFHDCWTFTAYCPHFTMVRCEKWKEQCAGCIRRREFSWFFDRSRELYDKKKRLFEGLDLTIVTPSDWLAGLVRESFLKNYPVRVIHSGIDLSVFRPSDSDFRKKYGLEDRKVLLGVSFDWSERKGLDVFAELSRRLPEQYRIVLVGTNDRVDRLLPEGILSIHRTQNQKELAEIYFAADLLVNPTREEVLGLVNLEALACGTPGVTFNSGGSPECYDGNCGAVVPCDDVDAMEREILRICEERPYPREACLKRAGEFDQTKRFKEYLRLYERVITAGN